MRQLKLVSAAVLLLLLRLLPAAQASLQTRHSPDEISAEAKKHTSKNVTEDGADNAAEYALLTKKLHDARSEIKELTAKLLKDLNFSPKDVDKQTLYTCIDSVSNNTHVHKHDHESNHGKNPRSDGDKAASDKQRLAALRADKDAAVKAEDYGKMEHGVPISAKGQA